MNPSLSTTERDGRAFVHCFSGCSQKDVITALQERGLWPRRREWIVGGIPHVRYDKPDGSKSYRWPTGTKTGPLPLYNVEALAEAPAASRVIVTEGEPAADALLARDVLAVATVCGASGTLPSSVLRPLLHRPVILWPDNDEPGRQHMAAIAERLHSLGHGDVRIVAWPDAPPKGDAADFRGDADALMALIDASAPCAPHPENGADGVHGALDGPRLVRLADVEPEDVEWIARPYVARRKLTLIEGDPGVGKSHVSLALATAVAAGQGFPGMETCEPSIVLLLSAEDGLRDTIRPRLDSMGADVSRIFAIDGPLTLDSEGFAFLAARIEENHPRLVVIDPIVAYLGGKVDLHRANEVRAITARLAAIAEQYDCAIVGVRHLSKGSAGRSIYRGLGSIDITAAARSVLLVGADPDTGERGVVQIKNNLAAFGDPMGYALDAEGFRWTPGASALTADRLLAPDRDADARSEEQSIDAWLRDLLLDGEMAAIDLKDVAENAGYVWRTVQRHLPQAGAEYRREGFGKAGRYLWSLTPSAIVQATAEREARHARHARQNPERGADGVHDDNEAQR